MGKHKLTPLEELHLEMKRLREERAIAEQRLSYELQYLSDNWRSLLTKGVTSSIKNKISGTVDNISSGSSTSDSPFFTKKRKRNNWVSLGGMLAPHIPRLGVLAWNIARPTLMAFAARKVTSLFFGKKRKRR